MIGAARTVVLVAHLNPDGDAVGSLLGLTLALESLGKQVVPVLHDPVPALFARILPNAGQITATFPEECGLCILLDAASGNRTGFALQINGLAAKHKLAVIDHHPLLELKKTASAYLHDLGASSTAELLLGVIQALEVRITPTLATCLLVGLYTDTGGFQHSNTDEHSLAAAAELMRRGGKLQAITKAFDQDKSLAGLRLLGLALERAGGRHQEFCTVSCLAHEDFQRLGAGDQDIPGIISQLNNLPGNRFSMLVSQIQDGIVRGSLRSNDSYRYNVNKLAKLLGGGGHSKASGFSLPGQLIEQDGHWLIEEVIAT